MRDTDITTNQLLVWLQEAENDIGTLAGLVEAGLANQGMRQGAFLAGRIAHKWEFRRNQRVLNHA